MVLRNDIIRHEVLETEQAKEIEKLIRRTYNKIEKAKNTIQSKPTEDKMPELITDSKIEHNT